MLTLSDAGLDLLCQFEDDRLRAYQGQARIWTIGYGHTGSVYPGETITEDEARVLLARDVQVVAQ